MAGVIYIKGVAVTKYKSLMMGLDFSFTDKRRFARVRLFDDPETVPPISELGPDALFEPMSVDNFVDSLTKKKIGIKAPLLDQLKIHPLQIASSLTRDSCEALHQSIQEVVKYAVDALMLIVITVLWNGCFITAGARSLVKSMERNIEFITAGGRTAAYVPQLQKLTGTQSKKKVVASPGQVSEDGDAKEARVEGEDDENLKSRKRVATFRAARGQQNKDAISAPSKKKKQGKFLVARRNQALNMAAKVKARLRNQTKLVPIAMMSMVWMNLLLRCTIYQAEVQEICPRINRKLPND